MRDAPTPIITLIMAHELRLRVRFLAAPGGVPDPHCRLVTPHEGSIIVQPSHDVVNREVLLYLRLHPSEFTLTPDPDHSPSSVGCECP